MFVFISSVLCLFPLLSPSSCHIFSLFPSISPSYLRSRSHLFWHSNIVELNFPCREQEYSRPVSPGELLEMRRHVRSLVGLFHTDPTQLYGWSPQRKKKHTPRSKPQLCSHVRQGWAWLQSDRQSWIKRSIHRVDWLLREYNSVCSILQRRWNTGSCLRRGRKRERSDK